MRNLLVIIALLPINVFAQNLIMNGDMEAGAGGAGVVPTNWTIVQHTPDNCASPPATCPGPSYVINNPSPNGGKWVRFFRGGGWNERFGQYICQPLVAGQTYTLEFWASHSDLNSSANATTTGIDFGFSNGLPGGTGAGAGNAGNVALTTPEVWQLVSVTFVASGNYDFISFAKNTTDTQNAAYVDGVTLYGATSSVPVLPPDTTLCTGASLLLDVSSFTGPYTWQDNSTNATYNVTSAGTYYVDIGANGGCQLTDTINVTYVGAGSVNLGPDTTLCNGQALLLDASSSSGPYLWQDGSTNATFNVTAPGQYYVDAGIGACVATDTINITYTSAPPLFLGNDTTICTGQNVLLDASSVPGPYLWSNATTNATLNVTTTGQYFVEAGSGGCLSYDTINVTVNANATINLGNDTTICSGSVLTLDASSAPSPYLWQDGSTNATFNVSASGQYYVDVGSGACSGSDTINVTVDPQLSVNLGNDTTLCTGQNLVLDVSAIPGTYLWQDASTNATYNVTTAGQYYVDITSGTCTGSDTINVSYSPPASVNLGNDTTLCAGQNLMLDASSSAGPYLWQDGSTNSTLNVNSSGLYSVQVGSGGCVATDDINVTFQNYPTPNLGPDQTVCAGTMVTLDPGTSGPYLWSDNSTAATLNVINAGTYWVEVGQLCTASDTIVISDVNVSVNMSLDDSTACDTLLVQFAANGVTNGAGIQNWTWDFGDGTTANVQNPNHFYDEGTYTVTLTVTTQEGCTASVTNLNWINVYTSPISSFTFDPQQPTVENTWVQFTDNSFNAYSWNWDFGGLGTSSNQDPSFEFPANANFSYTVELTVTDDNGCTDVSQQIVTIQDVIIFYVPNIFTPDGDAYNERFYPEFTSGIDPYNFHMTIFNRWGEIVFETYNKDIGWDGTYGDGGLVQDGTYIWKIEFSETMSDKRHKHYGHVTVLK